MTGQSDVSQPWYVAAFGAHYLEVYSHRDDADARAAAGLCISELGLDSSTRLLDLCCGAGRHLAQFAGHGIAATGLDLSADLLMAAAARLPGARLVRADIRALPFSAGSFDASVNLFSSFGYFADEAEDLAVLRELRHVLAPRAKTRPCAVFDIMNPAWVRATLQPESTEQRSGATIHARRCITEATGSRGPRVEKQVNITTGSGARSSYTESVRLYAPSEFDALLVAAGFAPLRRFGAFDGSPFSDVSPRQVVVAAHK